MTSTVETASSSEESDFKQSAEAAEYENPIQPEIINSTEESYDPEAQEDVGATYANDANEESESATESEVAATVETAAQPEDPSLFLSSVAFMLI